MKKTHWIWIGGGLLVAGGLAYYAFSGAKTKTQTTIPVSTGLSGSGTLSAPVTSYGAAPVSIAPSSTTSGLNSALLAAIGQSLTTPAQSVAGTSSATPQGAQNAPTAPSAPAATQCPPMTYSGVNGACTSIFLNATDV